MSVLIFIDPGKSGGSVAYESSTGKVIEDHTWKDDSTFIQFIRNNDYQNIQRCYIEKIGGYIKGRPQPGSKMFTMGDNYGVQRGIIQAHNIPLEVVTPQTWQKGLPGLSKIKKYEERKRALKNLAIQRFPRDHVIAANCDAFLMADWYLRKYGIISSDEGEGMF